MGTSMPWARQLRADLQSVHFGQVEIKDDRVIAVALNMMKPDRPLGA